MPDDKPLDDRLDAAAAYFIAGGGRLHALVEEVRKLQRAASMADAQAEYEYQQTILRVEGERDDARERAEELEEAIHDLRQGLRTPEEVTELVREHVRSDL